MHTDKFFSVFTSLPTVGLGGAGIVIDLGLNLYVANFEITVLHGYTDIPLTAMRGVTLLTADTARQALSASSSAVTEKPRCRVRHFWVGGG